MLNTHIELWSANENKLGILLVSTTNTFYDCGKFYGPLFLIGKYIEEG
jgi:hypothetical protein